ncbi:MAG: glutamyl-tRNA reductase, partial [Gammaproteobacteria bacterium]
YLFGISHHNTSLEEREQLVINSEELKDLKLIIEKKLSGTIQSLVNLSTCNRTEIIYESSKNQSKELSEIICDYLSCSLDINKHFFFLENQGALKHLCMVATGLDSRIIGEHEILGQFKDSIEISKRFDFISGTFESLLNDIISVAKSTRTESGIGRNPVSVSTLVYKLVREIYKSPKDLEILMIGAGEVAFSIFENFHANGISKLVFVNRSQKSIQLGSKTLISKPLNTMKKAILKADIIISSTRSQTPIIGKGLIEQVISSRGKKPLVLIDLGVPRNIEPTIRLLDGAYLYTLDQIESIAQQNQESRIHAANKAIELINLSIEKLTLKESAKYNAFQAREVLVNLCQNLDSHTLEQLKNKENPMRHRIIKSFNAELTIQNLEIESHVFDSLLKEIIDVKNH